MAISEVSDRTILQKVNQRLERMSSGAQSRITASVSRGDVTISGTLQYEMQRSPLIRAATSVPGIRRVIDHLQVAPPKKKWE